MHAIEASPETTRLQFLSKPVSRRASVDSLMIWNVEPGSGWQMVFVMFGPCAMVQHCREGYPSSIIRRDGTAALRESRPQQIQ
jgi:hypothetical protein